MKKILMFLIIFLMTISIAFAESGDNIFIIQLEEEKVQEIAVEQIEEPKYITLSSVVDNELEVLVSFYTNSIPEDARLIVSKIVDENYYSLLQPSNDYELDKIYVLHVSLVSGGIDYAKAGSYKLEIIIYDSIDMSNKQIKTAKFIDGQIESVKTHIDINDSNVLNKITLYNNN